MKLLIVIDIDETIVCQAPVGCSHRIKLSYKSDITNKQVKHFIKTRPHFDDFLKYCFEIADVGIWSMGQPSYVNSVAELFPMIPLFVNTWVNCDRQQSFVYKNLDTLNHQKYDKIIMIDDNFKVIRWTVDNIIPMEIDEWEGDSEDSKLIEIMNDLKLLL